MSAVVVVGAQWGDEGKGKVVDLYAPYADLVVRYAGGANAGHTLVVKGEKVILHLVPSGILHPGGRCVIAQGTVLDPEVLLAELEALAARGVQVEGRVLAMALKGADEEVTQALLSNLSKRAREGVLEEKELLGPQPLSAVQEAQQSMVGVIRDLVQSGQVKIRRGKEAQLVN